jgi:peptide/nickel transport system permease protein
MLRPTVRVFDELGRRLLVTVPLAAAAVLFSWGSALVLGLLSALRRGTRFDRWTALVLFGLDSVPTFWGGLVLALVFGAGGLGWLPTIGLQGRDADQLTALGRALDALAHAVLPVLTLSYGSLAYLSRQLRAGILEVEREDWMRAALARGLSRPRSTLRHALPNAALPLLTLSASILPALVSGSIVVETIFDLPGVGRYAYEGLLGRDYNVVLATASVSALMTLAGLFLSDLSYAWVDPRIRQR